MSHRFLLVQPADIGDLIVTTPAIAALREAHPDAHLTLLTSSAASKVIEDGLVDELVIFDRRGFNSSIAFFRPANLRRIWKLREGDYDTVIFFRHLTLKAGTLKFWLIAKATGASRIIGLDNGNGWFLTHRVKDEGFGAKHEAEYWLEVASLAGANPAPQRARVAFDRGVLPLAATQHQRVVIHAGSGGFSMARRWSPEAFAKVADALVEQMQAQIVLVGSPDDGAAVVKNAMNHPAVDLSGKTTLTQLADVLRSADVYIGADSGVMHLAAAVRTPVVAIFGPSNHLAWSPWSPGGKTIVLRSAPECSPCSYVGHGMGQREGCAARTCMRMVTPGMVLNAAKQLLKEDDFDDASEVVGAGLKPAPATRHVTDVSTEAYGNKPAVKSDKSAEISGNPTKPDVPVGAHCHAPSNPTSATSSQGSQMNMTPPLRLERGSGGEVKSAEVKRDTVRILGIPIDRITYARWMDKIDSWVKHGTRPYHVCTTNPEFMVIAQRDAIFRFILQRADLCIADGVGLLWAARILGSELPERVTGSDGTVLIAQEAAKRGWKLFLLGAAPGVAEQAAAVMREHLPEIQIAGVYAGSPAPEEEDAIVERVNASGADILLVAYGAPKQDKWIARNLPRLNVKMAMGVGGALDFIAGVVPRAPEKMREFGLEWLYRLYKQPWRLLRMLRLPVFVALVVLRGEK